MSNPYNTPTGQLETSLVFCRDCGEKISKSAETCPSCGAKQMTEEGRSKVAAGLLAIFLGGLGIHRFYLGQWWGLFYLLFFWTGIPGLIAFIEGIVFLVASDQNWNGKYGDKKGAPVLVLIIVPFVFIFIIGILAAIAIPAYQDYVDRARQVQIETQK